MSVTPGRRASWVVLIGAIVSGFASNAPAQQPAGSTSASAPAPSASAAPASSNMVMVHLRAHDPNAALQVRPLAAQRDSSLAGREGWVPACLLPCGVPLDRTLPLRVSGAGIAPSSPFRLPDIAREITVHASTGTAAREAWGEALVLTGVSTLMLGAITLLTLSRTDVLKNNRDGDFGSTMVTVTATTMSLGAVLLAIGIPVRWGAGTSVRLQQSVQ